MTFSQEVKNELARVMAKRPVQVAGELCGLIHYATLSGSDASAQSFIRVSLGNAAVARKVYLMIKSLADDIYVSVRVRKKIHFQQGHVYIVSIERQAGLEKLAQELPLQVQALPKWLAQADEGVIRTFLRGAFLACGSMTDPGKHYHLELVCDSELKADILQRAAGRLGLSFRISRRKNLNVVYLKEGEQIVQLLSLIGAHRGLLDLENIRVLKELRNQVNRQVNCETANVDKTINAAMEQLDAIRKLESMIGLENLPPALAHVAELRLKYPYASLRELGSMLTPPISKSGVNHRMRRLMELAGELSGQN